MSPEHDLNPSTAPAASTANDQTAENTPANSWSASPSAAVGTAVARVAESPTEINELLSAPVTAEAGPLPESALVEDAAPAVAAEPPPAVASPLATASALAPTEAIAIEPEATATETAATPAARANDSTTGLAVSPSTEASMEAVETNETMDQLMKQFDAPEPVVPEGEIFDGHVIAVTDAGVIVDVGGKFEGLVPAQEFLDSGSPIEFGKGQTIEVERLHAQKDGYVLLSHTRAHRRRVWERIEKAYREHTTITGKVTERIKGGLVVEIGVRSFLPASQIELRPVHDLDAWKDKDIEVRVLKLNRKRGNVVVSRRAILEEDQKSKRDTLMNSLSEGTVVIGKVKNVTDYGVFVDLGGMDGLLHVSDLVWGRVPHPSSIVKAGDDLEVQILKFDKEKQRISLGRKQLLPDPWATVPDRFPVGTRVQGKVVGVTDYGAFVQIEPGVEGLVHVSEMSWSKRTKHPSKVVKAGDDVDVVVLEVKTDQRRISLGLKQTLADPWDAAAEKYPVGTIVTGRIRNLAEFGAFIEIEEGMEGLIHISDVSWTERIKHPSEKFKKGDTVEAKVLKVDSENRRLSLGIKQLKDIWANWFTEHKIGEVIKGKVARTTDFGAFIELAEGIEGLCHVSEIEERRPKLDRDSRDKGDRDGRDKGARGKGGEPERTGRGKSEAAKFLAAKAQTDKNQADKPGLDGKAAQSAPVARGERVTAVISAGNEYDFKILRLDPEQHKISLSYRAAQKPVERKEVETVKAPAAVVRAPKPSPTATIGDAIKAKLQSA
jgi:small subunit ribosomal protein S1